MERNWKKTLVSGLLAVVLMAALVIAGLAAEGTTWVKNIHYVERGYERLIGKLTALGAAIRRVED